MTRRLIFSMLILVTSSAHASFEFGPIISTLTPSGAGTTTSFTVSNPGDTKIPVQVTLVAREPDENGKEVYKETAAVSEQFRLFPSQLILNPKETRTVRLTYIGTPKVKSELSYRIIAEELPVDVSDPKKVYKKAVANVNIAIKYIGAVYVTPPGSKSELVFEVNDPEKEKALEQEKDKTKVAAAAKKDLILTVTNKGTAHQVIRKPILRLQSLVDNSEVVLDSKQLPTLSNLNVLSGKVRKFTLEWPQKLPAGPVKASFDLSKE